MAKKTRSHEDYQRMFGDIAAIKERFSRVFRDGAKMFPVRGREFKSIEKIKWKLERLEVIVKTAAMEDEMYPRSSERLTQADVSEPGMFGGAP